MWTIKDIRLDLQEKLKVPRYEHTLRVVDKAIELSKNYKVNEEKAKLASLLHDCAKGNEKYYKEIYKKEYDLSIKKEEFKSFKNPYLQHCILGAVVAREKYKVEDEEVLNSIIYHTTGRVNMNILEKIVYLADKTENGRVYENVEKIRKSSLTNLNNAIILSINNTVKYLIENNQEISVETVVLRNSLIGGYVGR